MTPTAPTTLMGIFADRRQAEQAVDELRKAGFTEMLRMIRETEPDRPSFRLSRSHATLASISAQRRTEPAQNR